MQLNYDWRAPMFTTFLFGTVHCVALAWGNSSASRWGNRPMSPVVFSTSAFSLQTHAHARERQISTR